MKEHFFESFRISLPLIIAQMAQLGLGLTDTLMVGWYGTRELAALTLGHACIFFVYITITGFSLGIIAKVSEAFGSGNLQLVRLNVRMGIWLVLTFSILGILILANTESILILFKQEVGLIEVVKDYVQIIIWMLPTILMTYVFKAFLISVGKERIVLVISIIGLIINFFLNYLFIFGNFGMPELGLRGAAIASLGSSVSMLGATIAYSCLSDIQKYKIFSNFFDFDKKIFSDLFKVGWPICLTIMAESGMFSTAPLFMGWLGEAQLAAHGVVMIVFAFFFMIPLGISQAGTVRVAKTIGERKLNDIGNVAFSIYGLGLGWACVNTVVIIIFREDIINLFIDQTNLNADLVLLYATSYLLVCCLFHIADSGQILFAAILRGFSETKIPFAMSLFSYWAIGVPTAYYLSQHTQALGLGVYLGIGTGLLIASILLFYRYLKVKKTTVIKFV